MGHWPSSNLLLEWNAIDGAPTVKILQSKEFFESDFGQWALKKAEYWSLLEVPIVSEITSSEIRFSVKIWQYLSPEYIYKILENSQEIDSPQASAEAIVAESIDEYLNSVWALSRIVTSTGYYKRKTRIESIGQLPLRTGPFEIKDHNKNRIKFRECWPQTAQNAPLHPFAAGVVKYLGQMAAEPGIDWYSHNIERFGKLKAVLAIVPELKKYITLSVDKTLANAKIYRISKLSPHWTQDQTGPGRYNLSFSVQPRRVDDTSERSSETDIGDMLQPKEQRYFFDKGNILLLSEDESKIIGATADLRQKTQADIAREYPDFLSIVPEGVTAASVDLSKYSPRVAGFERPPEDEQPETESWGITWADGAGDICGITLTDSNGQQHLLSTLNSLIAFTKAYQAAQSAGEPSVKITTDSGDEATVPMNPLLQEAAAFAEDQINIRKLVPTEPELKRSGSERVKVATVDYVAAAEVPEPDPGTIFMAALPEVMRPEFQLDKHQISGVAWLLKRNATGTRGALVADEMGVGKTLQGLTFIALLRQKQPNLRVLVVCPLMLINVWAGESEKFFKDGTFGSKVILRDAELQKFKTDDSVVTSSNLTITNYNTFARFHKNKFLCFDFDVVIFDESQALKNPDTIAGRAARALKSKFVVCMTGTPIENELIELWTQIDICMRDAGNPLGKDPNEFKKRFISRSQNSALKIAEALGFKPGQVEPVASSLIMRRRKQDVLSLKEKKIIPTPVEMDGRTKGHEDILIRQLNEGKIKGYLPFLSRLQKLYQHPVLFEHDQSDDMELEGEDPIGEEAISPWHQRDWKIQEMAKSPKLSKTFELLDSIQAKGEKVIIFTLWVKMQDALQLVIGQRYNVRPEILNGATNLKGRAFVQTIVEEFSAKDGFNVLIASPKAAGTGLTITAANHVIHYGRWWNPASEDQATDRVHRKGQTKDVFVYIPFLHHPGDPKKGFDAGLTSLLEKKRVLRQAALDSMDFTLGSFDDQKEIEQAIQSTLGEQSNAE